MQNSSQNVAKMNKNVYIAKVGESADYRLNILNNIFRDSTLSFLLSLGLKEGMTVLEVGCGTGRVTADIAAIVGRTGHVHAIDISEEQIKVAKSVIQSKEIDNVTFQVIDAENLAEIGQQFNFVVSRFILMHLKEPKKALQAMYDCLLPEGLIACEEPEMSKCYSSIESTTFNTIMDWHIRYSIMVGLDFDIGNKLLPLFQELGFSNIAEAVVQPIVSETQPEKDIYVLLTDECRSKYIDNGIAANEEIDSVLSELVALTANPSVFFGCANQHQVSAKKPTLTY